MTAHLKKPQHSLARKLIHHVEASWTVWRTGIVTQIEIIILGKLLADAVQNRESAIAAVEDADGAGTT